MRIDAFNKISQLYQTNGTKNTTKVKSGGFSDMLEISQTGKDYQLAKQIVAQTSDLREDKINDIKKRMDAGNYHINISDVAEKLAAKYLDETEE